MGQNQRVCYKKSGLGIFVVHPNISGTSVSAVPLSIAPSLTGQLSIFEAPSNFADNYGQRIRGYVCAPFTGNYIFWIASDDNSELWLSTDDNPANKVKIASVSGYTSSRQWTKYSTQQSVTKYLVAGQKYYIEALHKDGSQGDNCAVGWQLPSGIQERPIPGNRLSPIESGVTYSPGLFAIIGDYGQSGTGEASVAALVKSWHPEYIITTGDNNYPDGAATTIDANIGQYYHNYIKPYTGIYGKEADTNRFFPSLGNHDIITSSGAAYFQYFNLNGNERYYDFVKGNVNFFVVNSNPSEVDGNTSDSVQATWIKNKLASSTSKWKIVYFHHSPYASDTVHGNNAWMHWPFKAWGADAVVSGHSHVYERVIRDSFLYLVNGLGGDSRYAFKYSPISGSQIRYSSNFGAIQVTVKPDTLWFKFYNIANNLIDSFPLVKSTPSALTATIISPANNSSFKVDSTITIQATAFGGTGPIQKVEFFADTIKLGEDVSSPYSFTWINVSQGNYILTVKATDSVNNTVVSSKINVSVIPPEVSCSTSGTILREVWNNISGTSVSAIPLSIAPNSTEQLSIFEAPSNFADNYGQRIRGYVCAPFTGNYIFWIASDDNCELWLSTDDNPANKVKIASVSGYTSSRQWTKYSTQQSVSKYLVAGQKYYIEALHKEGSQGDNCAVGWQLPNGVQERPISGNRISPYIIPLTATIILPTNSSSFNAGSTITIQATVSGGTGKIQKVDFFADSTKLGEDATSPYSFTWNNVTAGSYALTVKATDSVNNTSVSSKVTITVSPISTCSATGTITREVWNNIIGAAISSIPIIIAPNSKGQLTIFETPSNFADNYGQRIRGYVCPPTTGNYIFWIASDDNSELWLSTNDNPANKVRIASVTGYTSSRQWTKYPTQQSAAKYLVAGQKYYIEVLHKERTQGDNCAVGWQLPTGVQERPIPGTRLSPFDTTTIIPPPSIELIAAGSSWKYLDNGTNQGTAWRATSYNDATWKTGIAELGYGDGAEATVVSYGPSSTNKYITTYFRKTFNVTDISTITGLELSLIRDDGAVVYINGVEVNRNNLPSGTIYYNTLAPTYIDGISESTYVIANISSSALVNGTNLIAVEIHQNAITSSDISFNLKLRTLTGTKIMDASPIDESQQDIVSENKYDMIVYPNPNTGQFNLELCVDDLQEKKLAIEVSNTLGQVIYKKQPKKINGCVKEVIELDGNIPSGVYVIKVAIGDKIETKNMLLVK